MFVSRALIQTSSALASQGLILKDKRLDLAFRDVVTLNHDFANVADLHLDHFALLQAPIRVPVLSFFPAQLSLDTLIRDKIVNRKVPRQFFDFR